MKEPKECETMADLRAEIDALDRDLVALFARRVAFIDRAAQIKKAVGLPARISGRVDEVIDNAKSHARAHGLPEDLIERLWRKMIDWSIEREAKRLGEKTE
jgi:isochorismate pyruvate lyase